MILINSNKIKLHVFFLSWQIFGCMYAKQNDKLFVNDKQ